MVIDDLNFKLEYGEGSEGESYLESTAHKGVQIISVWGHPEAKPDRETEGAREIARRLAACWNACAGISTESLESNALQAHGDAMAMALMGYTHQNDLTVSALDGWKKIRGWADVAVNPGDEQPMWAYLPPDGESFVGGYATPEHAAIDALYDTDWESVTVGRCIVRDAADYVNVDFLLDDISVRAGDLVGEASDDWALSLLRASPESKEPLRRIIGWWENTVAGKPEFFQIADEREITRQELVDSGVLEGEK